MVKEQLEQQIDNYEQPGSGWVMSRFVSLDVNFYEIENTLQIIRAKSKSESSADEDDE